MPDSTLTALDLAQMQLDNFEHMGDRCTIMLRSNTLDSYGQAIATWTTSATNVPCGFAASPFKFRSRELNGPGEEVSELLTRTRLPIAYFDTIDQNDRLILTHKHGVALSTPETHEIQGFSERGPSGLVVNLQRVEL